MAVPGFMGEYGLMAWNTIGPSVTLDTFYKQLLEDAVEFLTPAPPASTALIGNAQVVSQLVRDLAKSGLAGRVNAYYADTLDSRANNGDALCVAAGPWPTVNRLPLCRLAEARPSVLIVAADSDKEDVLLAAVPFVVGLPKVVLAGYGHFEFRDPAYFALMADLDEPSLANGYPNSRIHLYQCLANAARLGLEGSVVEFGMFRGGTTMFLSRVVEEFGMSWPVIGFDTFSGFPPKEALFDMYDHEDLSAVDLDEVREYLAGRDVRIVPGDLRSTVSHLEHTPIVLAFVDTDNYTPASAAIGAIADLVVSGGAIVFDHVTGIDRFRYTLGERLAAHQLFEDPRYFNLFGTGVFVRQVDPDRPRPR